MNLPSDFWSGYPHIPLPGPVKLYYMMQTAFYFHLLLVINAEAPRKDHWQMMTHHVISCALIIASYAYNFTRVGCLIMVLMDWCDIVLPVRLRLRLFTFLPSYSHSYDRETRQLTSIMILFLF